jgi:hypothetical protein
MPEPTLSKAWSASSNHMAAVVPPCKYPGKFSLCPRISLGLPGRQPAWPLTDLLPTDIGQSHASCGPWRRSFDDEVSCADVTVRLPGSRHRWEAGLVLARPAWLDSFCQWVSPGRQHSCGRLALLSSHRAVVFLMPVNTPCVSFDIDTSVDSDGGLTAGELTDPSSLTG